MAKQKRLVDLIQVELERMGYHQKKAFKLELQETLPDYIRQAAQAVRVDQVKPDTETLQVDKQE